MTTGTSATSTASANPVPVPVPVPPPAKATTQGDLQKTFIAMLFAFAISVVAQQISELLIVLTNNWKSALTPDEIYSNIHDFVLPLTAIATHSLLAVLMLSISWVMWSRSKAAGHLEDIERIFSIKFISFLLEILLVTIYYSLSKSVEGDFAAYSKAKTIASYLTPISAKPEAIQMLWIFVIFVIWDLIVDVIRSPFGIASTGLIDKMKGSVTGVIVYCSVSIICALGAILVIKLAPAAEQPVHAIAGDVALIALLLLFYQMKFIEYYLCKLFPREATRENTKRGPPVTADYVRTAILVVTYLIAILVISLPCIQR